MTTTSAQTVERYRSSWDERLPESDGKPMAETDFHRAQMIDALNALDEHFRPYPQVYVSGNICVYYHDEAGERHSISPDVMVVLGVGKKARRYFNLSDEGKAPDVIIELISTHSKVEALGNKRVIYAGLGVRKYYVFDPAGEVFKGQLRGFRLEAGEYSAVMGARLRSEALGLDLVVEQDKLRFYARKTGRCLLTHEESEAARLAAEARAAQESSARQAAEAELARLREELARLQKMKPQINSN